MTLSFDENNVAKFVSSGAIVVQLILEKQASVSVLAHVGSLPPSVVATYRNPYDNSVIFGIDLPASLNVQIKAGAKVLKSSVLTVEG